MTNPFNQFQLINTNQTQTFSNDYNFPFGSQIPYLNDIGRLFYHRDEYILTASYISTGYYGTQSTVTAPAVAYVISSISEPILFTYSNPTTSGNFAICEPDETGFRSTATIDFQAIDQNVLIQWGLAIDNRNSTIAAGTAKRVTWDNTAGTSNFIDIPPAVSTLVNEATQQILEINTNPYEFQFLTLGGGMTPSRVAWDVSAMTFGSNTTLSNINNYPYVFNSSLYVVGTIEADTLIVNSTIFATSTIVESAVSTSTIYADYAEFTEAYLLDAYTSSLKASANYINDYIWSLSRHRMAGYNTPLSIVVGTGTNVYDPSVRFDFNTSQFGESFSLSAQPANLTIARFTQSNVEISNLNVQNLTTSTIVYSNATAPYIETSTINFGYTGDFSLSNQNPDYSLQQSLTTPPGTFYTNYTAASNQVLKIMGFSNQVNMNAQQFSTLFTQTTNSFGSSNIQGWASTIFANNLSTPVRVNLLSNSPPGQISFQANSYNVGVSLNTSPGAAPACNVAVPVGNTYAFFSDGSQWTTTSNAPVPGTISYQNQLQVSLDFETLNISTTDTMALSAEVIQLNGRVEAPNLQLSNLYLDGFLSSAQVMTTLTPDQFSIQANRVYSGDYNAQGVVDVVNFCNIVNGNNFTASKNLTLPNRGFNLFNSLNNTEWNDASYIVDTTSGSGVPLIILGEVTATNPSFTPYFGRFWINNQVDAFASNVPIYVNREGLLSTIGFAPANQYSMISTVGGYNWSIQCNVPNPAGITATNYCNIYTMSMTSDYTTITQTKPILETAPSKYLEAAKVVQNVPSIRVVTYDSPSFVGREAGFEFNTYFDSPVVFLSGNTYSDALNTIKNQFSNYYYSVAAWSPQIWISRIRTQSFGIQGFDIDAVVMLVSGTAGDYIWASARYLNVNDTSGNVGTCSIRENYFMTPKNYHTSFYWLGQ